MGIACFEEILVTESVTVHGSSCVHMPFHTAISSCAYTGPYQARQQDQAYWISLFHFFLYKARSAKPLHAACI